MWCGFFAKKRGFEGLGLDVNKTDMLQNNFEQQQ
jgi:hypothetical protein